MTVSTYQGQSVTLEADFAVSGVLVAVTGITLTVTDPVGTIEVVVTSAGITNPSTGVYQYVWSVPDIAPSGSHLASWSASYGGSPITSTEVVTVADASTETWCTVAEVAAIANTTVSTSQLSQAGTEIDVACGRPFSIDGLPGLKRIGARDLYWLKAATAWQAAWLAAQVDNFQRVDALAVQAGRRMIQLRDTALFLAPLARRALLRVSWLRDRSLHVQSGFEDPIGGIGVDALSAAADGLYPWSFSGGV